MVGNASAFLKSHVQTRINGFSYETRPESLTNVLGEELEQQSFGRKVVGQRRAPLRDILGLGPAEIAVTLVVGLVLFGPETLKSLSKDVGKAAAELKEIPKTFKEGMEEGAESAQVSKMKAIAAEKRAKRDAKLAEEDEEDEDE